MKKTASIFFGLALSLVAQATSAQNVKEISLQQALSGTNLPGNNQLIFGYELAPIGVWSAERRQALDLFPGYRAIETLNPLSGKEDLEIYESQASFVIDRSSSSLDFSKLSAADFLQGFDRDLIHQAIDAETANAGYQKELQDKRALLVRQLDAQKQKGTLSPENYEKAMANLDAQVDLNARAQWCGAGTECILSAAPFPLDWFLLLEAGKAAGQIDVDFPSQIEFFSEVQKGTPAELSAAHPEIVGLVSKQAYPASYVLVQSSFWFNRFIQSGKTVISLHTISDTQTLVVVTTAFAVEADALTKYDMMNFRIRDVFLGHNFFINRDQGFAKGLPPYNRDLAWSLKSVLERW